MDYTSIKVGQLPTGEISGGNFIPHEVAGVLKKATFTDLAAFIGASDAVGFRAVSVQNGGTLPTTDTQEFILVGPGTYNNVGGGSTITVTEELNALVSNGTYWFVGVQIPIDAPPGNAIWGQIIGTLSNQTDLKNILDLKADLVDGKVPASQLPSYVDDIIEVANYAALPATGETGKIYLTLDNNKIYRWSGSIYIEIAAENAVWGQIVGTLSNQTDLQSALNLKVPYTGATANLDLGTHTLSSYNLVVNHASGSGVAAQITKGGNGEALTVSKSSGTGNAASITGGTTLISELNLTTDLADAYIASAATWNAKIGGSGTTDYLPKFTGASTIGDSIMSDNGSSIIIGASGTAASKLYVYQNSSSSDGFRVFNANTGGSGGAIKATNYGSGFLFAGNNASSQVFTVENNGDITGNKFTKTGGTSSQFLKADGSIDSNTYCLDSDVVKLTGNQTIAGEKTFSEILRGTIFELQPNNTVGSNPNYIGQQMATNDNWKIYGNSIALDTGELVFELGDNAVSSSSNGQRFRFFYDNLSSGTSKSPFILDYNDAIFDTNASFSGSLGIGNASPLRKLEVASDGTYWISGTFSGTGNTNKVVIGNLTTPTIGGHNAALNAWTDFTIAGDNIIFAPFGAEKMRVNGVGNLGIGTTSPVYNLDIYSATSPASIGLKTHSLDNSVIRDYTLETSSFLDIVTERTDGGSFNFLLLITSTLTASAGFRSYYTLSVTGRGTSGNTTILSYTPILTPTRTAIAVSFPSNGVIRLTLSGGESCQIKATILGHGAR
jgi:hypothetical protein